MNISHVYIYFLATPVHGFPAIIIIIFLFYKSGVKQYSFVPYFSVLEMYLGAHSVTV